MSPTLQVLNSEAANLIYQDRKRWDLERDMFQDADQVASLVELARQTIHDSQPVPSSRQEARSLYEVFDHIVARGLWQHSQFAEISRNLLSNKNPQLRDMLIDCLHNNISTFSLNIDTILKLNPELPTQILQAAHSDASFAQVLEIFQKIGLERLGKEVTGQIISRLNRQPALEILSAAACLFARNPNPEVSKILHDNLSRITEAELSETKNQTVLRYLINHSPSAEVVKLTQKKGLNRIYGSDPYPGATGLLEAALYIQRHSYRVFPGMQLLGLGNLLNLATNHLFGPNNFSEDAALSFIKRELKSGQLEDVLRMSYATLKSSSHPKALAYLEKIMQPQGIIARSIDAIRDNHTNIFNNPFRKVYVSN